MNNPLEKKPVGVLVPLIFGLLLGGIVALLLAPESGSDLRDDIYYTAKKTWNDLSDDTEDDMDEAKNYALKPRSKSNQNFN